MPSAELRVLFRAPAGARRGFGHLVRCLSLARALEVRPLIALRGTSGARETALALGADVIANPRPSVIARLQPDVLIVDDPVASEGRAWIAAARRVGARVVSVHDLGLGCTDADLVIDGSITRTAKGPSLSLTGSRFAVLDLAVAALRHKGISKGRCAIGAQRVVIALGGGPHAVAARAIAREIVEGNPRADVRIAAGFVRRGRPLEANDRVSWVRPDQGLASELREADVAVVGGGVSLYEACALGVPTVTLPVVSGQVPTARAFARRGAVIAVPFKANPAVTASTVIRLLDNLRRRETLAQRSRALVDGQGAARAAAAVAALACRRVG